MRPRLLDLFCKAGGAGMGYFRAGFDVTGVDIEFQLRYPFTFVQADALEYLAEHGHEYAAIHASPPCQKFTQMSARWRIRGGTRADCHVDLLTPTRIALTALPKPWVIENVPGAAKAMRPVVILHGGMFGLAVSRPRLFESNTYIPAIAGLRTKNPIGVYGTHADGRRAWTRTDGSRLRVASSIAEARTAMGIDWMTWEEITQAIPPTYTEYIGRYLLAAVAAAQEDQC